ncbi:hypothetical protein CDAR_520371 [Caerostris darwini]|uniref:Uncharacterized protein n=1 Tax=Caerostris darwini TaxID=1538125 RepID=A0AAV4W705_9ARAC|nr:hypothetical protein CDAR_520371 [Caerostris darwini]
MTGHTPTVTECSKFQESANEFHTLQQTPKRVLPPNQLEVHRTPLQEGGPSEGWMTGKSGTPKAVERLMTPPITLCESRFRFEKALPQFSRLGCNSFASRYNSEGCKGDGVVVV